MNKNTATSRIPNYILDNLKDYQPSEFTVIGAIIRNGRDAPFSITKAQKMTGLSENTIRKAIETLTSKNVIAITKTGLRGVRYFSIKKKW